ncbi:MAG: hypothetical protein K2P08_04250 [Oscillospiraceae bacterium]|nr:hypothetical protein [Oscillospiraceae bacterium]
MMLADVSGLVGELSAMSEAEVSTVPVSWVLGMLRGALVKDAVPESDTGEGR